MEQYPWKNCVQLFVRYNAMGSFHANEFWWGKSRTFWLLFVIGLMPVFFRYLNIIELRDVHLYSEEFYFQLMHVFISLPYIILNEIRELYTCGRQVILLKHENGRDILKLNPFNLISKTSQNIKIILPVQSS